MMEIQQLKQKTLKTDDIKNTESVILDSENIYYNDKEEVIKDINKIVDEKINQYNKKNHEDLTFKFTNVYLEMNKIKDSINDLHNNEKVKKSFEFNINKSEILSELIKSVDNIIFDKVKAFIEGMSNNSPENKPFKKSFFSCASNKK